MVPIPRYVNAKCCSDEQHMTNHGASGFWQEMEKISEHVSLVIEEADLKQPVTIIKLADITGNTELYHTVPTTEELWGAADPVHLTEAGYQLVAEALKAQIAAAGQEDEPAVKKPRLDSIVPPAENMQRQIHSAAACLAHWGPRPRRSRRDHHCLIIIVAIIFYIIFLTTIYFFLTAIYVFLFFKGKLCF